MNSSAVHEVMYNEALYKLIGLYHILDPNRKHINNCHIYRLVIVVITIAVTGFTFFGTVGFFIKTEYNVDMVEHMMCVFEVVVFFSAILKMYVFVYKAQNTWDLLDMTRIHFLSSSYCETNEKKLNKCKNVIIRFTNHVFGAIIILFMMYTMSPLATYLGTQTSGNSSPKLSNVLNMKYPVKIETYNKYYYVFFIMESIMAIFDAYSIFIDTFLLSIALIVTYQYEILAHTFECVGIKEECDDGKFFLLFKYVCIQYSNSKSI